MNKRILYAGIVLGVLALVGRRPLSAAQQAPELRFETAMQVDLDEEFHICLGVRNVGQWALEGDNSFNGQMELRHVPSDELRASAEVIPLSSEFPGRDGLVAGSADVTRAGVLQANLGG